MKRRNNQGVFAYKKDIGRVRVSNDDDCKIATNSKGDVILIVADGMGGYKKGDYASSQVVTYLINEFKESKGFISVYQASFWVDRRLRKINLDLYNLANDDKNYSGMGTTLIMAIIIKNKILVINIGDSRCYFVNGKSLVQISEDQTYVNYLYKSGQIEKKDIMTNPNRHVLTNAIGLFPSVSFDRKILNYENQKIFLCSDGLYNNVSNFDIEAILNTNDNVETKVNGFIKLANFNGGSDNISCCLWEPIYDKD